MNNCKSIHFTLLILVSLSSGCGTPDDSVELGSEESDVVYGTDNRTDVFAHPDAALRARAQQSTVALMRPSSINTTDPNNITFNSPTLQASQNLCLTERFLNDPTASFCSGTLIDDDKVLTAGHCVRSASDCSNTRFVFNYYRINDSTMQTVSTADIFSCASIIAQAETSSIDYAVLRLDRPATPRFVPAPIRPSAAMSVGQNVAVIGTGSGIPFKIDSGGSVRDARAGAQDFFVATTDTFGGNSGSGVYETKNYTLAGILVRGEIDYVARSSCNVVNTCSESGCSGEDITYVTQATAAVCAAHASSRLCPVDEYLVGDWDGDGRDNLAIRYDGCVFMDLNFDGFHDLLQCYGNGQASDQYLVGDWDGDGRDNLAIREGNCIFMDFNFDGLHDLLQCFGNGNAETQYLAGDWDGDGRDNLATRSNNIVKMDFDFNGTPNLTQTFGSGFGQYLVGDWDGDGRDNLATRSGRTVQMDFNFNSTADLTQSYGEGNAEGEYLSGDWEGDGRTNLAVRRINCVLMDFNFDGFHNFTQCYGNGK